MNNRAAFLAALTREYARLFEESTDYAMAKASHSPATLAEKMLSGLLASPRPTANMGPGIVAACKALKVRPTFKAIREYCQARRRLEDAVSFAEGVYQGTTRGRDEAAALADLRDAEAALEAFQSCDACMEENFVVHTRSMSVVESYASLQEAYDRGAALGVPFDVSEVSGAIVWVWEMRHA